MSEHVPIQNLDWAIAARERSQRLLLSLYAFGDARGYGSPESPEAGMFSVLAGVAFSLWRAAFLADAPTRTVSQSLDDATELLKTLLRTNTISFAIEHTRQGWTAGYYLKNAKLRLVEILSGEAVTKYASEPDLERIESIRFYGTDPHVTWKQLCDEAERLAQKIGCKLSPSLSPRP